MVAARTLAYAVKALGKKIDQKVFFLHIPKCGGTAVTEGLRTCLGAREYLTQRNSFWVHPHASFRASELSGIDLRTVREVLLLNAMAEPSTRFVAGHFYYSDLAMDAFGTGWNFVTVLREPVSLWLSTYFYNRYKKSSFRRIEHDLDVFVDTEDARRLGHQMVAQLTDRRSVPDPTTEEAIEAAIDNLSRFAVVGTLEDLDGFARRFQAHFGVRPSFGRAMVNPVSRDERQRQVNRSIRARIEQLCAPNLDLYERACRMIAA